MKYLIQHPEPIGIEHDLMTAGDVVTIARAVEAAGWDGLAFTEHPAPGFRWLAEGGGHQTLDPFVALGAAAAVTERISLLTYLAVVPYRNPLILAKAAATVDLISNGRFILGIGTGYLKTEFFALGVDFEERNVLFDEALDVLPSTGAASGSASRARTSTPATSSPGRRRRVGRSRSGSAATPGSPGVGWRRARRGGCR